MSCRRALTFQKLLLRQTLQRYSLRHISHKSRQHPLLHCQHQSLTMMRRCLQKHSILHLLTRNSLMMTRWCRHVASLPSIVLVISGLHEDILTSSTTPLFNIFIFAKYLGWRRVKLWRTEAIRLFDRGSYPSWTSVAMDVVTLLCCLCCYVPVVVYAICIACIPLCHSIILYHCYVSRYLYTHT